MKINQQKNQHKNPSILFVNMPSLPLSDLEAIYHAQGLRQQPVCMPLGIMYISSYLKKFGKVGQIGLLDFISTLGELVNFKKIDGFIKKIAEQKVGFIPDIVAFSFNLSVSYQFFLHALNLLSAKWPDAKIVVGGAHATNSSGALLKLSEVDYVIRGEAEKPFVELVNNFSVEPSKDIRGVYTKDKLLNSTSAKLESADLVDNLDELPFPDRELIDMDFYATTPGRQREMGSRHRAASLITTRGCPNRCTFCSSHSVHGRKMRFRTVKNIIEEIKLLHDKYDISFFMPEDDLFTIGKERVRLLLKTLKELNIPGLEIQTPNALSVNTLDEEVVDDLIGAGMRVAVLAIESGSKYVQEKIIKKYCNLEKAKWLVNILRKKGITVRCFFILGLPAETKELMQETVDYAKSLNADWCSFNIATPLVGSEMYSQFISLGVIKDDEETWLNTVYDSRRFDTPEITAKELNDFVYRANLECNFINNPNKISGQFEKAIIIYRDILSTHPFHIIAWHCLKECYQKLGNGNKVKRIEETIKNLIKTDKRAQEMFVKYGEMMSGRENYG